METERNDFVKYKPVPRRYKTLHKGGYKIAVKPRTFWGFFFTSIFGFVFVFWLGVLIGWFLSVSIHQLHNL